MQIAIVGAGRMGVAQARLARILGDKILFAIDPQHDAQVFFAKEFGVSCYRSIEEAYDAPWDCLDLVWLVVCDDQIQAAALSISRYIQPHTVVFHTSGALSSQVIKRVLPNNPCASLHPLVSCPLKTVTDDECLRTYQHLIHTYEGDDAALGLAKSVVARYGADLVQIDSDKKSLYHAAAVFVSNYPVTLLHIATNLFETCGMTHELAKSASRRLLSQTSCAVENAEDVDALTGPAKRHDMQTIAVHQHILEPYPELLNLYNGLLGETLKMLSQHPAKTTENA